MKTYKWITITVLTLLLSLPAMTVSAGALHQAARSASVSLTLPTPNPVSVGSEVSFDLVISVANINPGVAGADIYLKYNSALVAPPSSPTSVAEAQSDFFGATNVSVNEITQCPGSTSSCVHIVLAGPAQVTHNGNAARFHFRGIADGSACFSIYQSTLADANGFQVDNSRGQDQCVPVVLRVTASGTVLRQGVPANPNPGAGSLACSTAIANGTPNFGPTNTDGSGKFSIPNVSTGTYTFRATYPGFLASEKPGVVVGGGSTTMDVGTTTLRGGDVNGDNAINILDIGTIISKFGKTGFAVKSASANCTVQDESTDINDDGLVNISDLAIAAGNWGSTGPTPWQ
jgi:hypothetical protein